MPFVRCGDTQVYYEDTGGDGPVVFLAHGFAMDHSMFAGQTALAPRWRVIAWDARGHGKTESDGQPFTYWDLARDLLRLMDALDVAQATLGGVSQGGFISLRAALLAPERVSSLLLFDTEAGACSPADLAGYREMFDVFAERGPVEELVTALATQIVGDHPTADSWARHWSAHGIPLGEPTACLLGRDDIVGRLGEIRCPALLIRGERDTSIPWERTALLHENMANATSVHVIAGAGHSPPLTHQDETNAIVTPIGFDLYPQVHLKGFGWVRPCVHLRDQSNVDVVVQVVDEHIWRRASHENLLRRPHTAEVRARGEPVEQGCEQSTPGPANHQRPQPRYGEASLGFPVDHYCSSFGDLEEPHQYVAYGRVGQVPVHPAVLSVGVEHVPGVVDDAGQVRDEIVDVGPHLIGYLHGAVHSGARHTGLPVVDHQVVKMLAFHVVGSQSVSEIVDDFSRGMLSSTLFKLGDVAERGSRLCCQDGTAQRTLLLCLMTVIAQVTKVTGKRGLVDRHDRILLSCEPGRMSSPRPSGNLTTLSDRPLRAPSLLNGMRLIPKLRRLPAAGM
jgi:pimeloyl-ACP methyl ester carboxylesterase